MVSGLSTFDIDDIADPDRNSEENENISKHIYKNNDTILDIINNIKILLFKQKILNMNAHIIFNSNNLPVGINPDIMDTISRASP